MVKKWASDTRGHLQHTDRQRDRKIETLFCPQKLGGQRSGSGRLEEREESGSRETEETQRRKEEETQSRKTERSWRRCNIHQACSDRS